MAEVVNDLQRRFANVRVDGRSFDDSGGLLDYEATVTGYCLADSQIELHYYSVRCPQAVRRQGKLLLSAWWRGSG